MKVLISNNLRFVIAVEFASWVHAQVVTMQLRASYGIHPSDTVKHESSFCEKERLAEMRAFIRSIKIPTERRSFNLTVKYLFNQLRIQNNTESKWQDYVKKVRLNVSTMKEAA